MSAQLPPPPEGPTSGFPYSILWEEFAQIWERLDEARDVEGAYETLIAEAEPRKLGLRKEPSRDAIRDMITPLQLPAVAADELEAKLYRIAAAYRIPQLTKALGLGAAASKKHLARIAAASAALADLLENTPLTHEVVLGLLRKHVDPTQKLLFNFKAIVKETGDLARTAKVMADEIPLMPRGTSANILRARLMEATTRTIGEAATDFLEVLQADTAGRKPRPKSTSAHVLFAYLDLVDPGMTDAAKVRLFAGHNCGPQFVSWKELEALPPRRWPQHEARKKLMR